MHVYNQHGKIKYRYAHDRGADMGNKQLLYHITHVTNLSSILEQGGLQSHLFIQQHELTYFDVANRDVQSRRNKKVFQRVWGQLA